ncbi:hypothetical protein NMG60_11037052 [Bertholletia excelsa]
MRVPVGRRPRASDRADDDDVKGDTDEGSGMAAFVADTAKGGAVKAAETLLDVGDKVKETADNTWAATNETTRRVKDAVAGDDGAEPRQLGPTDSKVADLRKGAGGYDLIE